MMLYVNVVLIPQASPTCTSWLRRGYMGEVTGNAGIMFIRPEGFFSNCGERKCNCLGTFFPPLKIQKCGKSFTLQVKA